MKPQGGAGSRPAQQRRAWYMSALQRNVPALPAPRWAVSDRCAIETPHTALYEKDQRAFSSGCIRVEDALGLAKRLLHDPEKWSDDALAQAIAGGETREVGLKRPMPVLLLYWTVDVQADGRTTFKPDVYGLDAPLLQALDAKAGARRMVDDKGSSS